MYQLRNQEPQEKVVQIKHFERGAAFLERALKEVGQTPLGFINFVLTLKTPTEEKVIKQDEVVSLDATKNDSSTLIISEKSDLSRGTFSRTNLELKNLAIKT